MIVSNHPSVLGRWLSKYVGGYAGRGIWGCPSAKTVDEWHDGGRYYPKSFWQYSTYGIHQRLTIGPNNVPQLKITSLKSPATTIFCQDAAEQKMDGGDDSLSVFSDNSKATILSQWIGSPPGSGGLGRSLYNGYQFEWEWFRHNKKCQTLWVGGNVSVIPFKGYVRGIDYRWYTGDPRCPRRRPLHPRERDMLDKTIIHTGVSLCLSLTFSAMIGCKKAEAPAPATPAEAQAAMQDAFKQANPDLKAAADETAAAIEREPAKALGQLQGISANVDLTSEQRRAAEQSMFLLLKKLRDAAAKGDANAEQALDAYQATK
jgi:hypothetical protein